MRLYFKLGGEMIIIDIRGTDLIFTDTNTNQTTTIEGLALKKQGILKQFPDLDGKGLSNAELRTEAIKRLKKHIKELGSDDKIKNYLVEELKPSGYVLQMIEKRGFRPEKVKNE